MSKNEDFTSKLKELDEINQWFQSDEIDLDEGLKKLKRAKELIKFCKGKLHEVENEFTTIKDQIEDEAVYIAETDVVIEKKTEVEPDLF